MNKFKRKMKENRKRTINEKNQDEDYNAEENRREYPDSTQH